MYMDDNTYELYEKLIKAGVAKELARIALPVSIYTEFYWKTNLLNFYKFIRLRNDSHAQKEIRDYASAMYEMVKEIAPISTQAFEDYQVNNINLTSLDIQALRTNDTTVFNNKRELQEYIDKKLKIQV